MNDTEDEVLTNKHHYGPFVLDVFRHGKRKVVDTVCLVIFPLISLKKDQLSSLNGKVVKAVVLGPESSDTEIKDAFEVRVFTESPTFVEIPSPKGFSRLPLNCKCEKKVFTS